MSFSDNKIKLYTITNSAMSRGVQGGPPSCRGVHRGPPNTPNYTSQRADVNLSSHTKWIVFEILLNYTKIRLYLPFSDWFGSKQTSFWFQINLKMVNTIGFQFDLLRFRKYLSLCRENVQWTKRCNMLEEKVYIYILYISIYTCIIYNYIYGRKRCRKFGHSASENRKKSPFNFFCQLTEAWRFN